MGAVRPADLDLAMPALGRGVPVLTPSLRMARVLRAAIAARESAGGGVAVVAPVDALGAWLERQWRAQVEEGVFEAARVLSGAEAEELWLQVIEADLRQHPDFSLLQPRAAARTAQHGRESLLQYRAVIPDLRGEFQQDADCQRFYRWLQAFNATLAERHWLTTAEVEYQLGTRGQEHCAEVLVFADKTLTPVSRTALERVAGRIQWLPLEDELPALTGRTYNSPRDEQRAAAEWAAARQRQGAGRTAIVALNMAEQRQPIETALREAFDCLDARYDALPVNFSRGIPFADAPLYRDALLALRLVAGPVSRRDLLAATRSPYLAALRGESEDAGARLIKAIFATAADPIPVDELMYQLRQQGDFALSGILDRVVGERLLYDKRNGGDWRATWLELLAAWGWPARTGVDSYEYQQIERLDEILDYFEQAMSIHGMLSYQQALGVFGRVLERRQFQPSTPDDAVQVLSEREARGMAFDGVWILGAQSDRLPRRAELLPFVPAGVQRALGMPVQCDPDGLLEARSLFSGIAARSGDLVVSWHRFIDGIEQLPSPLLCHLETVDVDTSIVSDDSERWRAVADAAGPLVTVQDRFALPVEPSGDTTRGGAGLLRDQSQCPFKAWMAHRLRVRPLDDTARGLTPSEKGDLLHLVLKCFWQQVGNSDTLHEFDVETLQETLDAAIAQGIRGVSPALRRRVGADCLDLEARRLQERLSDWLLFERSRQGGFKVVALEQESVLPLGKLSLRVVVDRIDELADGRRLVIDYKSSDRFSARDWWGERLREPQLPAYAMLNQSISGIAWGVVSKKRTGMTALGDDLGLLSSNPIGKALADDAINDWPEVVDGWQARLQVLADEFMAGDAAIAPMKRACDYCRYQPVCRIDMVSESDTSGDAS